MPITLTCQHCGKSFQVSPSVANGTHGPRKYCSNDCKYAAIKITERADYVDTNCLTCGKPLHVLKSRWNDGRGRYCSQKCMIEQRPSPEQNRVITSCELCGKEFETYPSWIARGESRFCSRSCAAIHRNHIKGIQSPTSIEQLLIDELDSRNIAYEFQYPFERSVMDFAFPDVRLCVEADGVYWHSLPNVIEKDAMRDQLFHEHGWLVIHFTGDEIRVSPERCVDTIERALFDLRNPIEH